ncbi:NAD(P)/FAD-dependent oxidoreductase [Howardella ureilytica]
MIVINQIKAEVDRENFNDARRTDAIIKKDIAKKLKLKSVSDVPGYKIIKKSLDARKKPKLFYIYSVLVDIKMPSKADRKFVSEYNEEKYAFPYSAGNGSASYRPVIVGFGPGGMFSALLLARAGFKPIVLERGRDADSRSRDVECYWNGGELKYNSNVQFGEGGAGTFSDGKLYTGIGKAGGRVDFVLESFVKAGACEDILYESKPHIGTDILCDVVKNIRKEIISLGGEVRFNSLFDSVKTENGEITGCSYTDTTNGKKVYIETGAIILAIGHSARDTFRLLRESNVKMEAKGFAVGMRVIHRQSIIDRFTYGESNIDGLFPASDYKLTAHTGNGRGVYSFCMCPGGYVVDSSSEKGRICVNGMSYSDRNSGYANSAIIVNCNPDDFGDDLFSGMYFQEELEHKAFAAGQGKIPVQSYGDYKAGKIGCETDHRAAIKGQYASADLRSVFPEFVNESITEAFDIFNNRIEGFNSEDTVCAGVESRTSSPVRILRDERGHSSIKGLFPCGEGAGYAGGITSAAVDGIKCAENVAVFLSEKC